MNQYNQIQPQYQQQNATPVPLGIDKQSILRMKDQFAMALPSFYTSDRFARACFNVLNPKNQKDANTVAAIKRTTPESFFGCLLACASLGLEPNGPLGHAYLIPYAQTCQLIIGYKGLIDLARRSGDVQAIVAHEVCQNDVFEFDFGTGDLPHHTFDLTANRGNLIAVYAVAKFKDGSYHFDLMTKAEVDKVRNASKAKTSTPWTEHYVEMAKKTIIRRIAKYLPMDVQKAAAYDGASLKYDSHSDNSGLVFGGYEDDDSEREDYVENEQTDAKVMIAADTVKEQSKKLKAKQTEQSPQADNNTRNEAEAPTMKQFTNLLKDIQSLERQS